MKINELTDKELNTEIQNYEDKIETLDSAIEYHDDNITKNNIKTSLDEYIQFLEALKSEKKKRLFVNNVEIDENNALTIIDNILTNINTRAIFVKNSFPGKMHFETLSSKHLSDLNYNPSVIYQIYLPFDLEGMVIQADSKKDKKYSIDDLLLKFNEITGKSIFIQKVDANVGRNAFDRMSNPEVAEYLNLVNVKLWQGIMLYFFL